MHLIMPQSIFVQVGQCGNQVGQKFWDLALQEYYHYQFLNQECDSFFKIGAKGYNDLKARAVLIDMEEGVVSNVVRGHLKSLFDSTQLITDVSGSGNNWAVGNRFYGLKYREHILDLLRKEAELCDFLQCFCILHSMGGGTGSGLGTAVVNFLHEEFPNVPRFVFATYPSSQDDVVTSPYNTLLGNSELIKHASCVVPFENKALIDMCCKYPVCKQLPIKSLAKVKMKTKRPPILHATIHAPKRLTVFDEMNSIIANVILHMTSSSRFSGSLNMDINDIVVNMTPYPKLHYIIPNLSPLSSSDKCTVDQIFNSSFSSSNQLFQCSGQGTLLACAILCRGPITMSDVQSNIDKQRRLMKFVPWNENGWKIGLCDVPQIGHPCSVLVLSNTSAIANSLSAFRDNFMRMFKKKAHLHHFLEVENMEIDLMKSAVHELEQVINEYKQLTQISFSPV